MAITSLIVNNMRYTIDGDPDMPLLWALRDELGLTGTKYGCGMAQCGACTVHIDGEVARSCVTPLSAVGSKKVTTIEGLSPDRNHPLQIAWIAEDVPQCGYCQSGQIMCAAAMLARVPKPDDAEIDKTMALNISPVGASQRIRPRLYGSA